MHCFVFGVVHYGAKNVSKLLTNFFVHSSVVQMKIKCLCLHRFDEVKLVSSSDDEAQLKRMESGSLLAICAMCLSTSFFVMMPSSFLKSKRVKKPKYKGIFRHFILC